MLNLVLLAAGVGLVLFHERKAMSAIDTLTQKVDALEQSARAAREKITELAEQVRNGGSGGNQEDLQALADRLETLAKDLDTAVDEADTEGEGEGSTGGEDGEDTGGEQPTEPGAEEPQPTDPTSPFPTTPTDPAQPPAQDPTQPQDPAAQARQQSQAQNRRADDALRTENQQGKQLGNQQTGQKGSATATSQPSQDRAAEGSQFITEPIPGRPMQQNPADEFIPAEPKPGLSVAPAPSPLDGQVQPVQPGKNGASTGPTDAHGNPVPVPVQPPGAL